MTTLREQHPEYAALLRRYRQLEDIVRRDEYLSAHERAELIDLNQKLHRIELAFEQCQAEQREAGAVASLDVICTDYEAQREFGDMSGPEL